MISPVDHAFTLQLRCHEQAPCFLASPSSTSVVLVVPASSLAHRHILRTVFPHWKSLAPTAATFQVRPESPCILRVVGGFSMCLCLCFLRPNSHLPHSPYQWRAATARMPRLQWTHGSSIRLR